MLCRKGKFGPIRVAQRNGVQMLLLNEQVQGAAFMEPGADIVDETLKGPGPIASSPYTYGWLLGGIEYPFGSGLMVGLGSGIGAVQLLYNFPDMDLTVVEIDPVMAEVALRSFPLLDYYINLGRLHIVLADASDYCSRLNDTFDIGFVDAYDGGSSFALLTEFLPAMQKHCKDFIINSIDGPLGENLYKLMQMFKHQPLKYAMRASIPEMANQMMPKANFVLTTIDLHWPSVDMFLPFADRTEPAADYGRLCWNMLTSNPLPLVLDATPASV